jgi:AraC-like DNA-binding protein
MPDLPNSTARAHPGWGGRALLSPGRLLYVGPGSSADRHAHHAIQVVLGFEASFSLDLGDGSVTRSVAIVPADVPHQFCAADCIALLYLEPEGGGGRGVQRRLLTDPAFVESATARLAALPRPHVDGWKGAEAHQWSDQVVELLGGVSPPAPMLHPAVRKALDLIASSDGSVPRLDALAARVGVSGTRLTHLFSAQVGLPLRKYVLWWRLKRAAEATIGGASLTEAAYAAGFADGAHLSRTFRAMFGTSPSLVMPFLEFAGDLWAAPLSARSSRAPHRQGPGEIGVRATPTRADGGGRGSTGTNILGWVKGGGGWLRRRHVSSRLRRARPHTPP